MCSAINPVSIELVPADPSYAEMLFAYRQDPITVQYNPLMKSTLESTRERLQKARSDLAEYETSDSFFWFVKLENEIVGNVTVHKIDRSMCTAEIGYGVYSNARGKGVATQAIRAMMNKVFTETPIRKLIAYVHEANVGSRKALTNNGFREEGFLREHYVVNGEPVNEILFGILRKEWDSTSL